MTALGDIRDGGKPALARTLSEIEKDRFADNAVELLDAAYADAKGQVLGLTGPPGVGKSTLTKALIDAYRARGETVGVLAIDPSSRVSGGALLGDRTRLKVDPEDIGVFVRSMAAGDRLGGLSEAAIAAAILMRAVFNQVIVESVGVGQSEADIGVVADVTLLCIQPGSGDSLQFMKAGIMEMPDLISVTKSDIGAAARLAAAEVEGALSLGQRAVPVIALSAETGEGIADLVDQVSKIAAYAKRPDPERWIELAVAARFGDAGLSHLKRNLGSAHNEGPFATERRILLDLERHWQTPVV